MAVVNFLFFGIGSAKAKIDPEIIQERASVLDYFGLYRVRLTVNLYLCLRKLFVLFLLLPCSAVVVNKVSRDVFCRFQGVMFHTDCEKYETLEHKRPTLNTTSDGTGTVYPYHPVTYFNSGACTVCGIIFSDTY